MNAEINFIEQKKKNLVPFLIGTLFILLITGTNFILYEQVTEQQQQLASITEQLDTNLEKQSEVTDYLTMEEKRQTLRQQVESIEPLIFPTVTLLNHMNTLLPRNGVFDNYSFTINEGIDLDVRLTSMKQVANYIGTLETQSFITNVELSNISKTTAGDSITYVASLRVSISNQPSSLEVASP